MSLLLRQALWTRRAFLGTAPAGLATAAVKLDDTEDLTAAERLLGLESTPAERALASARLAEQRDHFAALRAVPIDANVAPATQFRPWLPGLGRAPEPNLAVDPPASAAPGVDNDADLAFANIHELAALLRAGRTSSVALTKLSLARLQQHDPKLLCVVTRLEAQALEAAARADAELAAGHDRGPLHGIPFGAKDLLAWPGAPTTWGAEPFRDQILGYEATVLAKLRDAGAVLVAKLSLGALAMGDVWFAGKTRNPWKPSQGSSGSSAGSASAVAAGLVPFAIGSETYGSIVSPCSRCGATGLRPTFGTVSRFGAMALSWTMDKLGPIARTAADCALVFDAIRGADRQDADAVDAAFGWQRGRSVAGLHVGYLARERNQAPVAALLDLLRAHGAALHEVAFPDLPYDALLLTLVAEAACAFDDAIRAGKLRQLSGQAAHDWPNLLRSARLIPAVDWLRMQRIRSQLVGALHELLAPLDAIVAAPHGNAALAATNLGGEPCVVLPAGARRDQTPVGVTIVGKLFGEAAILSVAELWQRETSWHRRRPLLE